MSSSLCALFVCALYGLFFKARCLALAEQCHTQIFRLAEPDHTSDFYLKCFKSDFDSVKSKFGLFIK